MFETEQELLSRIKPVSGGEYCKEEPVPDHLTLQWHITDRCNLKCPHCDIADSPLPDTGIEKIYYMVENYVKTLKRMNINGRVHVTGGEPFMRRELFEFLGMLRSHKEISSFSIQSNGTMIDQDIVKKLAKSGCEFIRVSIDGGQDVHDSIRREGPLNRALFGIRLLKNHGIPVSVSFTVNKYNFMELGNAADVAFKAGAGSFLTERIIPVRGSKGADILMNEDEITECFVMLNNVRKKLEKKLFSKAEVSMGGALQFLFYDGEGPDSCPYSCKAGRTELTVLADGRVVPCRSMPVIIGDIKTDDLYEIYNKSPLLNMLRNTQNIPSGCEGCKHSRTCNGGLKCLSYAVYGNPFIRDPQCTDALLNRLQPSV